MKITIERLTELIVAASNIRYGFTDLSNFDLNDYEYDLIKALENLIDARITNHARDHSDD